MTRGALLADCGHTGSEIIQTIICISTFKGSGRPMLNQNHYRLDKTFLKKMFIALHIKLAKNRSNLKKLDDIINLLDINFEIGMYYLMHINVTWLSM